MSADLVDGAKGPIADRMIHVCGICGSVAQLHQVRPDGMREYRCEFSHLTVGSRAPDPETETQVAAKGTV